MALRTVNPTTGERIAEHALMSPSTIAGVLEDAQSAFRAWSSTPLAARVDVLRACARVLREDKDAHARLMALEMGKPVAQGRAEIEKCAWTCELFAEKAPLWLAPELVPTQASASRVVFEPLGVVLAVMPWNFPFWQVFRFAVPALAAGNAMLLKHAEATTGCALAIEAALLRAGAPAGLAQVVLVDHDGVAELVDAPQVRAVTLTGSTRAGREVAPRAARALKKTVLELGGSDPYLVLADADVRAAARTCAAARLVNGGQSCVAAKRFIVVEDVLEPFTEGLVAAMAGKVTGDPLREDVDLGPLARLDLRDALHAQVRASVAAGARIALGGEVPSGPGAFYPPTVLDRVRPGMPAFDEELFGPVAAVVAARDEEDAIRLANDSAYGLGAAVFTTDVRRGEDVASRLQAGCVFVNAQVQSDPRLPFGGVKDSGYGRELSHFGLREFVNVKTVWVG